MLPTNADVVCGARKTPPPKLNLQVGMLFRSPHRKIPSNFFEQRDVLIIALRREVCLLRTYIFPRVCRYDPPHSYDPELAYGTQPVFRLKHLPQAFVCSAVGVETRDEFRVLRENPRE